MTTAVVADLTAPAVAVVDTFHALKIVAHAWIAVGVGDAAHAGLVRRTDLVVRAVGVAHTFDAGALWALSLIHI